MRAAFALVLVALAGIAGPAAAQSVGYVTGIPGRDPAGDDEIGWGPAYRPETSFSQPGTPPTPGDFAGAAYRARTGRGVYDDVQGPTAGFGPAHEAPVTAPRRRVRAQAPARHRQARVRPPHRQAAR
ncbi:hypothetical protein [Methylobacterium sp. ID0610]|uniref:hypothetical protein n=1 Tax=Methylobacterium carpenticola TaxID=3344827 RepID=UPI003676DD91